MRDTDAEMFERVHAGDGEGEAFHGPALKPLLRQIPAGVAAARPVAGAHTIWEIVLHLVAWHDWAVARLDGRDVSVEADGWTAVADTSDRAWSAACERIDASHARLVERIRALPSDRTPRQESALRFLLHHDVYHAGQVGLLRRASAPLEGG